MKSLDISATQAVRYQMLFTHDLVLISQSSFKEKFLEWTDTWLQWDGGDMLVLEYFKNLCQTIDLILGSATLNREILFSLVACLSHRQNPKAELDIKVS